jgi:hypothetical protein
VLSARICYLYADELLLADMLSILVLRELPAVIAHHAPSTPDHHNFARFATAAGDGHARGVPEYMNHDAFIHSSTLLKTQT